jgi:hypothetical protein
VWAWKLTLCTESPIMMTLPPLFQMGARSSSILTKMPRSRLSHISWTVYQGVTCKWPYFFMIASNSLCLFSLSAPALEPEVVGDSSGI